MAVGARVGLVDKEAHRSFFVFSSRRRHTRYLRDWSSDVCSSDLGIDRVRDTLADNTERFARGLPANNALLWGARGMGKSSLVKAVHAEINKARAERPASRPLKLVEIHREDIETLPELMALLRPDPHRFIVFCDDLSFDANDTSYKSLKAVLEGGIEGRPDNVIFYATSNRRHLLPRDMMENERSTADRKSTRLNSSHAN